MTDLIYTPKGRAGEYAGLACNLYRGCTHGCTYCYVPPILRMPRADFHAQATPRADDILEQLEKEAAKKAKAGLTGQVFLSFTTDPYQPCEEQYGITRDAIQILHRHGFGVRILTKSAILPLRDIGLFRAGDAFGVSCTASYQTGDELEPGAAYSYQRMMMLERFHNAGVYTWVSMEPLVCEHVAYEAVDKCHQYVDEWRIGALNHCANIQKPNYAAVVPPLVLMLRNRNARYLIKDDLAQYIPEDQRRSGI